MSSDTQVDTVELDQLRNAYKAAVEEWIVCHQA
jgi:hypothetical protein